MNLKKILIELKSDYIKNFPNHIEEMRENFLSQNKTLLRNQFHKLKGSGKTYGLPEVSELSEVMEEIFDGDLSSQELKDVSRFSLNLYESILKHYKNQNISSEVEKNIQKKESLSQFHSENVLDLKSLEDSQSFRLSQNKDFLALKEFTKRRVKDKVS